MIPYGQGIYGQNTYGGGQSQSSGSGSLPSGLDPAFLPAELALDPDTWDVAIPIRILKGPLAVVQRIKVRFRFFLGEWFLDQNQGIPYYQNILVKNPDIVLISGIFRQVLSGTPGVKSVDTFTARLVRAARELDCDFQARLDDGTVLTAKSAPFVIQ